MDIIDIGSNGLAYMINATTVSAKTSPLTKQLPALFVHVVYGSLCKSYTDSQFCVDNSGT